MPLIDRPLIAIVAFVAVAALVGLSLRPRARTARWWRSIAMVFVLAAASSAAAVWFARRLAVGTSLARGWEWAAGFLVVSVVGVAIVNLVAAGSGRRLLAVAALVAVVATGGIAVARHPATVTALRDRLAGTSATATATPHAALPAASGATPPTSPAPTTTPSPTSTAAGFDPQLYNHWKAPADLPKQGVVRSVSIPGTVSHFAARNALVYLPPAALVEDAPRLPVVVLMSGQPASPASVIVSGNLAVSMNALAAAHDGLAPIVVIPDQLGPAAGNPMCVDGPLGNSATYIRTDVTAWIRTHLHVEDSRQAWTVGGYSQGGTCALQFATADPATFASFVDVSGEEYPTLGTDALTIEKGFRGSGAAFERAKPSSIMSDHGHYDDTVGYFAVGQEDHTYRPGMYVVSAKAASVGIHVTRNVVPGLGHSWTTATIGFRDGIGFLFSRLGLAAPTSAGA